MHRPSSSARSNSFSRVSPLALSIAALVATLAALTLLTTSADAKKKSGFKTGTYSASGDVTFRFKVFKGTCYSNSAKKKLTGYCFKGLDNPKLQMDCPEGPDNQSDYEDLASIPANVYIPKSGKLNATLNSYWSSGKIAAVTEFKLMLGRKGKGSGSISKSAVMLAGDGECVSGPKSFSAKK